MAASGRGRRDRHTFAADSWGGEWHPDFVPEGGDVVIKEHWAQSGFANIDLDFQLKQRDITHVIAILTSAELVTAIRASALLPARPPCSLVARTTRPGVSRRA